MRSRPAGIRTLAWLNIAVRFSAVSAINTARGLAPIAIVAPIFTPSDSTMLAV
jgi:hypothetical protein